MTPDGKVVNSRYDKFKQINRFLEYINDILPSVMELKKSESHPLQIADFGCEGLIFKTGNIAEYSDSEPEHNPDIVITLHACDTATDFALKYAVEKKAKAILSVPCCQHEINQQLERNKKEIAESEASVLAPVLKHGLLRERTAALITDALRADYLERWGYKVDVMEFIDMSHTPKNILLRCVRKPNAKDLPDGKPELLNFLKISPAIYQ